ncbi:hypothetical protein [Priestia megaterium]|uniref:hypothetical protein n=1 Tax=Priestia megaterium TaxID=1404 RepID=UPI000BFE865E|nr:hypothetical protein [Priestia megaterium]PGQ88244.1 hypothetical protein COA18_04775 [Priestia megaterium]
MRKIIEQEQVEPQSFTQLARMEDVSEEELQKRFLEDVREIQADKLTDDEIRIEKEKEEALGMLTFLGLEDEVDLDLDNDPLGQISQMCTEAYKDKLEENKTNSDYMQKVREYNNKEGVEEIDSNLDFTNKDDPFLAKEFEREREKITAQMAARRERGRLGTEATARERNAAYAREQEIAEEFEKKSGYRSSTNFFNNNSTSSTSSTSSIFDTQPKKPRSTMASSETTSYSNDTTEFDREKRAAAQKGRNNFISAVIRGLLDMIYNGKVKEKEAPKSRHFGSSKRFSIKGMWNKTKDVFKSKEAALWIKIGAMITLQAGMAMLTNNLEFDGPLQAIAYMGMALGAGYIAREIRAAGFDARRINFL